MERTAYAELCGIAFKLGEDECRVLARIARRLEKGQAEYGYLELDRYWRDPRKEAREEVEDALVYFAFHWLKNEAMKGGEG